MVCAMHYASRLLHNIAIIICTCIFLSTSTTAQHLRNKEQLSKTTITQYIATMSDNGGDRSTEIDEEEQTEEVDAEAMEVIRQSLRGTTLEIGDRGDVNGIFANARSFVKLSKGNDTVQEVLLYLYEDSCRDYKTLCVLVNGLGNLEGLRVLTILSMHVRRGYVHSDEEDDDVVDDDEVESLYQQAFASAFGRVRLPIELRLVGSYGWGRLYFKLAAIRGVSNIRSFRSFENAVSWEDADTLMAALASLPSLDHVTLGSFCRYYEEGNLPPVEEWLGLTNLLKSPSLRSIEFSKFKFTSSASRALLSAFEEGSSVTCLLFTNCNLVLEDDVDDNPQAATIVQALQRNSSVKCLSLVGNDFDGQFSDGITIALLINTTLVDLTLRVPSQEGGRWLQPLFVAMRINTTLKSLDVNEFHLTDDLVCGALRNALADNSVLESLALYSPDSLDDRSVISWCKTLPFIRDSATLKSLKISFDEDEFDSDEDEFDSDGDEFDSYEDRFDSPVANLSFNSVAMLKGNTTLECLDIKSDGISPDAYFAALESLQPSSTLKTLRLSPIIASMGEAEMNQVVSLVRKNYSLAVLDEGVSANDETGELGILLRLNQAGRRYLIEDAASITKGVEVLISVGDDIGCLFYHLLENPTLCDIEHQYNTKSGTGLFLS
jgi:hypothetical protein